MHLHSLVLVLQVSQHLIDIFTAGSCATVPVPSVVTAL
jgi:hypothetical protein